jgi:hypothetical protein
MVATRALLPEALLRSMTYQKISKVPSDSDSKKWGVLALLSCSLEGFLDSRLNGPEEEDGHS